jgi:hypothetical protein
MSTEDPTSNVVSLKPTEEAAPVSASELARKLAIDRRTVQRRIKRGWTPPVTRPKRRRPNLRRFDRRITDPLCFDERRQRQAARTCWTYT